MERQRWLLLPGERDRAENHIGFFLFPLAWLIIWFLYRTYDIPWGSIVWPFSVGLIGVSSLWTIYNELWLYGWFSASDDGIRCDSWVTNQRFIPWEAVTDVCLTELALMRGNDKDMICCCLNGSKPPRRKWHNLNFYSMRKRKYFIVRYSDERYTYFLQKTGKIVS